MRGQRSPGGCSLGVLGAEHKPRPFSILPQRQKKITKSLWPEERPADQSWRRRTQPSGERLAVEGQQVVLTKTQQRLSCTWPEQSPPSVSAVVRAVSPTTCDRQTISTAAGAGFLGISVSSCARRQVTPRLEIAVYR